MAVNPHTKMVFVPSREICVDIKSAPLGEGLNPPVRTVGKPYWGIGTIGWNPGYGQLVAFDGRTGEKAWTVKAPSPYTSGLLTTGGGLVFAGHAGGLLEGIPSGKPARNCSRTTCGSGIFGSPMTYAIDGKQYVAVPAGFGGWTGWAIFGKGGAPQLKDSRKGGYLMVFGPLSIDKPATVIQAG